MVKVSERKSDSNAAPAPAKDDPAQQHSQRTRQLMRSFNQRRCPKCESSKVRRVHRNMIERWLSRQHKFSCGDCQHRFYDYANKRTDVLPM